MHLPDHSHSQSPSSYFHSQSFSSHRCNFRIHFCFSGHRVSSTHHHPRCHILGLNAFVRVLRINANLFLQRLAAYTSFDSTAITSCDCPSCRPFLANDSHVFHDLLLSACDQSTLNSPSASRPYNDNAPLWRGRSSCFPSIPCDRRVSLIHFDQSACSATICLPGRYHVDISSHHTVITDTTSSSQLQLSHPGVLSARSTFSFDGSLTRLFWIKSSRVSWCPTRTYQDQLFFSNSGPLSDASTVALDDVYSHVQGGSPLFLGSGVSASLRNVNFTGSGIADRPGSVLIGNSSNCSYDLSNPIRLEKHVAEYNSRLSDALGRFLVFQVGAKSLRRILFHISSCALPKSEKQLPSPLKAVLQNPSFLRKLGCSGLLIEVICPSQEISLPNLSLLPDVCLLFRATNVVTLVSEHCRDHTGGANLLTIRVSPTTRNPCVRIAFEGFNIAGSFLLCHEDAILKRRRRRKRRYSSDDGPPSDIEDPSIATAKRLKPQPEPPLNSEVAYRWHMRPL